MQFQHSTIQMERHHLQKIMSCQLRYRIFNHSTSMVQASKKSFHVTQAKFNNELSCTSFLTYEES